MAKLDRFLISTEWSSHFPNTSQATLPNTSSDHCPLLCTIKTLFAFFNFFCFENFYLKIPEFIKMVHCAWSVVPLASNPQELHYKLLTLSKTISDWSRERVGNIIAQVKIVK
jgi:hypothetical protein